MAEERVIVHRQERGTRGITGAIILIGLGVAFLLQNLGVVGFDWFSLLRFWPILLILFGLDLLLARSVVGSLLAALAAIGIVAGVLFLARTDTPAPAFLSGRTVTRDIESYELADDIEALDVRLNIGAAAVNLDADAGPGLVVEGSYRTDEELVLRSNYRVTGSTGQLEISQERASGGVWVVGRGLVGEIDLSLPDRVPIDLYIDAGASDLRLDLTGMQLRSLTINGGVGTIDVQLPEFGEFSVDINGGVGTVTLHVPEGLEAQASVEGLTSRNFSARFREMSEGVWATAGYDMAENRATIDIDAGVGTVNVR
ncbi:MAG TPA: DUF5668 domain-containing protein [Aggregatilineales bacterium]|nr:DUF5668 domain-containing protein [Aggregatilineales bacterium]